MFNNYLGGKTGLIFFDNLAYGWPSATNSGRCYAQDRSRFRWERSDLTAAPDGGGVRGTSKSNWRPHFPGR